LFLVHSLAATDEVRQIASEFIQLADTGGIPTLALEKLSAYTTDLVK